MNRSILTHHTLAFDAKNKKLLIGPIILMIVSLLLVILAILFYLTLDNQAPSTNRAAHSVVSIIQNQAEIDIFSLARRPSPTDDIPVTDETNPVFAFSAEVQSDLWRLVYFGSNQHNLSEQYDVELTITTMDTDIMIVEPVHSLQAGTYCFYERDWFARPTLPTYYCFEMKS